MSYNHEKFSLFNNLAILLKAIEGERTSIDLRNEASIYGTVKQADGYMNIFVEDCIFTDPRGSRFPYEIFFVQARNIRYVHIPPNIPIIPAIRSQLKVLSSNGRKEGGRSLRDKRIQENQLQGKAAMELALEEKMKKE